MPTPLLMLIVVTKPLFLLCCQKLYSNKLELFLTVSISFIVLYIVWIITTAEKLMDHTSPYQSGYIDIYGTQPSALILNGKMEMSISGKHNSFGHGFNQGILTEWKGSVQLTSSLR